MRVDSKNRLIYDKIAPVEDFIETLNSISNWFSGVPDSMLKKIIPELSNYFFSPRENHAISMAFGARIAGANPCVLMQNSGLGLSLDALMGLHKMYKKGILIILTQRGELEWEEIQHRDWGEKTVELLNLIDVDIFDYNTGGIPSLYQAAESAYTKENIAVLLLHRGNIDE